MLSHLSVISLLGMAVFVWYRYTIGYSLLLIFVAFVFHVLLPPFPLRQHYARIVLGTLAVESEAGRVNPIVLMTLCSEVEAASNLG